jgi:hypothetical protein
LKLDLELETIPGEMIFGLREKWELAVIENSSVSSSFQEIIPIFTEVGAVQDSYLKQHGEGYLVVIK